jgi:hypothetical protein
VRAQAFPDEPGFAPHFRIFCLATAGRERRDHALLSTAIVEHITTHLSAWDRLERHGYAFPDRQLTVRASGELAAVADRIAAAVPGIAVQRETLDHAYYDGIRFLISARTADGNAVPLADGGAFDWLVKLTSNRRLLLVASGMGAQLAALRSRPAATA